MCWLHHRGLKKRGNDRVAGNVVEEQHRFRTDCMTFIPKDRKAAQVRRWTI
jgi:hypothetical protein